MTILLSYKPMPTHFFGDSWESPYELTVLETRFFGLVKREKKIRYVITMFQNVRKHKEHWDELIKTKRPLT